MPERARGVAGTVDRLDFDLFALAVAGELSGCDQAACARQVIFEQQGTLLPEVFLDARFYVFGRVVKVECRFVFKDEPDGSVMVGPRPEDLKRLSNLEKRLSSFLN